MDSFCFVVTFIGAFLCCEGRYFRPFPISSEPQSVFDAIESNTDLQYNDNIHWVTAIRDVDLRSCYVKDYDPDWRLDQTSKAAIMQAMEPKIMRDDVVFSQFIRRVGPIIGKLCRTSKIYNVDSMEAKRVTGDSPKIAAPPPPDVRVPPKIYFDSGDSPIRRPFKIPTKKPQFQGHQGMFKVPTKIPKVDASQGHQPVEHSPHDPSGSPAAVRTPLIAPRPFQQAIPQLKHRGHKQR